MKFIHYYTDVSGSYTNVGDDDDSNEISLSLLKFIDDTEIQNNPSDYYCLKNVTTSVSDAERDAFSQSDVDAFMNKDVETRHYCFYSEGKKEDDFSDSKVKIEEFKDTLVIPNEKDDKSCLFYSLCYAIFYVRTNKLEKCSNEELKPDLPDSFF